MTTTQPIIDDDVARVTPGVVDTIIGDRVVVVHPADDTVHILNETAALIWTSLTTALTVGELIAELAERVGLSRDEIADDVRTTLARFVHADIATVGPPSFILGPPDFTAEHHGSVRRTDKPTSPVGRRHLERQRRSQPAHPLLARLLDRIEWTTVIGPARASGATVIVRTNSDEIGSAMSRSLSELPIIPVDERTTVSPDADDAAAPDGGEQREPSPRVPAFTDTEFRPGVFRATDPRAITREPSRPRTPDPRVPYDPRAEQEPEDDRESRPTVISALDTKKDGPRRFRLFVDDHRVWHGSSAASMIRMIGTELNQICVEHTTDHILFHAGAVERDGKVILIAGDSGYGKSTLTAALTGHGFRYLTDEIAAVEPTTLEVLPYPKAIDLDETARDLVGLGANGAGGDSDTPSQPSRFKASVEVEQMGTVSDGGTLALFVLLGDPSETPTNKALPRSPGNAAEPEDVETLIRLLGTVFRPSFVDPRALPTLASLQDRVPILHLERLALEDGCAAVRSAFDRFVPLEARTR